MEFAKAEGFKTEARWPLQVERSKRSPHNAYQNFDSATALRATVATSVVFAACAPSLSLAGVPALVSSDCCRYVENGDVVGICVSGGLDSKTVALRLRLAGVKAREFVVFRL